MLTYRERKGRIPFGAVSRTAERTGVAISTVSAVLKGRFRNRRIEIALASLMTPKTTATQAFGPPSLHAASADVDEAQEVA